MLYSQVLSRVDRINQRTVPLIDLRIENFDLNQIAESGQCFRMQIQGPDRARVVARGRVLEIEKKDKMDYSFSCTEDEFNDIWRTYFDLETDYGHFTDSIDPEDEFLRKAASYGSGIRILRQEPFETLISFIISQRKNIPAIRSSVEKLSRLCGDRIGDDIYAFPEASAIAGLSEKELGECSLGYRAPYVREAARQAACGELDLDGWESLPDDELFKNLMSVYGVGKKIANCVMLFAYHRIAAFPVDVWIKRIEDQYYGGTFPVSKYPGYAGVLQQYMFAFIRNNYGFLSENQ
ncbi:MAG: DNA-3-methyladenine glycosylase 2 family protein [Lachnospiraceae bacterium]|nr:DNA-3-methyladenine glycosylase 2 family protein [Lachnospiraceae bacterium]